MVNKVVLVGNLGRDPELSHTQSGQPVARLSVATTAVWTKDGERQRRTEWHHVVVWGASADGLRHSFGKVSWSTSKADSARGRSRDPTTPNRCARRSTRSG